MSLSRRNVLARLWALPAVACLAIGAVAARADEIVVSAAASLTNAFTDIGAAYTLAHPGTTVRFNFGASGILQTQIEAGAPVDVFASASPKEMDKLQSEQKIVSATRIDFASNRLALIAPATPAGQIAPPGKPITGWDDLASPDVKRIAISNPASVPSGRYAQATLTHRNLWDAVKPKAVFGENVRQTLEYVAAGNADAGIVFTTDALVDKDRVRVVAIAEPGKDHPPILYPAAVVASAPNAAAARSFVAFLRMKEAMGILQRYGFMPAP
jgi:molybdate transport system substrate-binding protein